jgi:hypothetical protein
MVALRQMQGVMNSQSGSRHTNGHQWLRAQRSIWQGRNTIEFNNNYTLIINRNATVGSAKRKLAGQRAAPFEAQKGRYVGAGAGDG